LSPCRLERIRFYKIAGMANRDTQHIFFVDDQQNVREVIGETLKQLGLKVRCFATAEDCLRQLRSQRCDLLITDLRMPGMSGLELLTQAKRLIGWMPVLVVSGYGDVPTAVAAAKAGADDFIEKPLEKEAFLGKVTSILRRCASINPYMCRILTSRQMQILLMIADGKSSREIAEILRRTKRNIEVIRSAIMQKLGVDNVVDLVKRSAALKLIDITGQPRTDKRR
jgi:two-component system response regulator FixJ